MSNTKIRRTRPTSPMPVPVPVRPHHGSRRLLPAQITPEGASLGAGIGLTIFGGAAVLAEAMVPGSVLLSAGLACLGVSWKMS